MRAMVVYFVTLSINSEWYEVTVSAKAFGLFVTKKDSRSINIES